MVLVDSGKDRKPWVNHIHSPWWSCLEHSVDACTVIRCGSIISELQLALVIQHGLNHFPMKMFRWLTQKNLYTAADLGWSLKLLCLCLCCPARMPEQAELKNEGLSGSLTPPGPAPSFLLCQEKQKYIAPTNSLTEKKVCVWGGTTEIL